MKRLNSFKDFDPYKNGRLIGWPIGRLCIGVKKWVSVSKSAEVTNENAL